MENGIYHLAEWLGISSYRRFRKIMKSHYYLRHVCLSVRPHGTIRQPLDGFL